MTELEFKSYYPDAPQVFIVDNEIAQLWRGSRRVFLFTHDNNFEPVRSAVNRKMFRISRSG